MQRAWIPFIGFTSLLFMLLYLNAPLLMDDFWFLGNDPLSSDRWADVRRIMAERWPTESFRFGNFLVPALVLAVPKWIHALVTSLFIFWLLYSTPLLAGCRGGSTRGWLLAGAIVLCLPWYDFMFSTAFSANYVWALSLCSFALMMFLGSFGPSQPRGRRLWGACVLIILAGWCHEGMSLPMGCGCAAYLLMRLRGASRNTWIYTLCFVAGMLLMIVSPAFWNRADVTESNFLKYTLREALIMAAPGLSFYVPYLALFGASLALPAVRRRILAERGALPFLVMILVGTGVSLGIYFLYFKGPRQAMFPQWFSLIGLAYLSRFYAVTLGRAARICIDTAIAVIVSVNLIAAIMIQRKLTAEAAEITRLFRESPDGTVYYDNIPTRVDLSMLKSSVRQFNERVPMTFFSYHNAQGADKMLKLLPSALADFDTSLATPSRLTPGGYLYGSLIVTSPDNGGDDTAVITLVSPDGTETASRFRQLGFTDRAGNQWLLIIPHASTFDPTLRIADFHF